MNLTLIELGLSLLYNILGQYKKAGAATEIVEGIQASIAELEKVRGTDVTAEQLESLRVQIPAWAAPAPTPAPTPAPVPEGSGAD